MFLCSLLFFCVKYKNKIGIKKKLKYLKKYDIDKYKVVANIYNDIFVMCNRKKLQKQ